MGVYYLVPSAVQLIAEGKGWAQTVCGQTDTLNDPMTGYWVFFTCVSYYRTDPEFVQAVMGMSVATTSCYLHVWTIVTMLYNYYCTVLVVLFYLLLSVRPVFVRYTCAMFD